MPGRHRQLRRTGLVVTAAGLVLVVAGGAWAGYQQLARRCTSTLNLKVAAAAEIAPAVKVAADTWAKRDDAKVDGSCVAVAVTVADPATMAVRSAGPPVRPR